MKTLSIVCARGGSKGLKNKCSLKINNRMLIEFPIEYSLSLGKDVTTIVSTDIDEVIALCNKNRIACIRRDAALCRDESRIEDAIYDALDRLGTGFIYVSLVYGNVPTRHPRLFHDAVSFLDTHPDYDAVLSMQNVEKYHPDSVYDLNEERLPPRTITHYRRQTQPQKMIHDGHTVIFRIEPFLREYRVKKQSLYSIFMNRIKPMINHEVIIDIDTEKDYRVAKAFLESTSNSTGGRS